MKDGQIHVYYGEGKGKTTAATGLCLRAAGHGWQIGFVQFLKDGSSGEIAALSRIPGVRVFPFLSPIKFVFAMSDAEKAQARLFYDHLWQEILSAVPDLDLLVLDEIFGAIEAGMVEEGQLKDLFLHKPAGLELVLTGRHPTAATAQSADYLMEIRSHRHPYDKGVSAREGIEW